MLSRIEIEQNLIKIKPELASNFNVCRIGFFGSFVTGQQNENSDLDILVEFSRPIGWKFFELEKYLEQAFGIPVDLVTASALKERIKDSILTQVHYV